VVSVLVTEDNLAGSRNQYCQLMRTLFPRPVE